MMRTLGGRGREVLAALSFPFVAAADTATVKTASAECLEESISSTSDNHDAATT